MTTFTIRVWRAAAKIPNGKVSTYGDIARALGRPGAARAVGNALNKSPGMPQVPCHRVVGSDGRIGGFAWGTREKIKLLEKEGIQTRDGRVADFKQSRTPFKALQSFSNT